MDACLYDRYSSCSYDCYNCLRSKEKSADDFNDLVFKLKREEELLRKYEKQKEEK